LEEANQLLDAVAVDLNAAGQAQRQRKRAENDLQAYRRRLILSGGVIPNANRMGAYEDQAKLAHEELARALNRLEELGIEVKDLDMGLVDFPTWYRGETVYLCYRLGESEIRFWHGTHEGYKGRKPIDADFEREHTGDFSN
jgi:hypothetical protein